jgi:cytochrome c oxidase assembly protein subunit 11
MPPHTTVKFPVLYFIDPQFASDPDTKDYSNLVLAYTFFPAPKSARALGG